MENTDQSTEALLLEMQKRTESVPVPGRETADFTPPPPALAADETAPAAVADAYPPAEPPPDVDENDFAELEETAEETAETDKPADKHYLQRTAKRLIQSFNVLQKNL